MYHWLPFWPRTAAVTGVVVNNLYIAELSLCILILSFVLGLMVTFCVRYHHTSDASRANPIATTWHWEMGWTAASFVAFLVLFAWGASVYVWLLKPPAAALEIFVVGKQWMWKMEHPGGQREIDALHVPVDKTVRLVLTSEDVIHSFFVPAFRVKHDVLPGTYEVLWFKTTKTGAYQIECSQYCGTGHALMRGTVYVMTANAYAHWLTNQGTSSSLAAQGKALFRRYGCSGCHDENSTVHAPSLVGLYGHFVHLQDGTDRRVDATYIRDCLLEPRSFTVAGYPPIMPSFKGELGEDDIIKLIAYIQSMAQ